MSNITLRLLGDAAMDFYQVRKEAPRRSEADPHNWRFFPILRTTKRHGAIYLLCEFLRYALEEKVGRDGLPRRAAQSLENLSSICRSLNSDKLLENEVLPLSSNGAGKQSIQSQHPNSEPDDLLCATFSTRKITLPKANLKKSEVKKAYYRIDDMLGLTPPTGRGPTRVSSWTLKSPEKKLKNPKSSVELAILWDGGDGIRLSADDARHPIKILNFESNSGVLILKTVFPFGGKRRSETSARTDSETDPVSGGEIYIEAERFFDTLTSRMKDISGLRTICVTDSRNLRRADLQISPGLSWERTAFECVRALRESEELKYIRMFEHVVIRLGLEGALYFDNSAENPVTTLFFDPETTEGEFHVNDSMGVMQGYSSIFTAAIGSHILNGWPVGEAVRRGIREGIISCRRQYVRGFWTDDEPDSEIHLREVNPFCAENGKQDVIDSEDKRFLTDSIQNRRLEDILDVEERKNWPSVEVLEHAIRETEIIEHLFMNPEDQWKSYFDYVREGIWPDGLPKGKFGKFESVDRAEIENLRGICRSLQLFVDRSMKSKRPKPVSIGVFGPPGSGKSFVTKELMKVVFEGRGEYEFETFNLSELSNPAELTGVFHRIHDHALSGKMPVAFFDEFDATVGEQVFGWLRYFLAPMNDGEFRDSGTSHPIGAAIFVFGGGTRNDFEQFADEGILSEVIVGPQGGASDQGKTDALGSKADGNSGVTHGAVASVKLRDFVSRLSGYVNVKGPNPVPYNEHEFKKHRIGYRMRRAILLRSFLFRYASQVINKDRIFIDQDVVRAFISAQEYKHGSRSMEAIVKMSSFNELHTFTKSALPPSEQLGMHVSAKDFLARLNYPEESG